MYLPDNVTKVAMSGRSFFMPKSRERSGCGDN